MTSASFGYCCSTKWYPWNVSLVGNSLPAILRPVPLDFEVGSSFQSLLGQNPWDSLTFSWVCSGSPFSQLNQIQNSCLCPAPSASCAITGSFRSQQSSRKRCYSAICSIQVVPCLVSKTCIFYIFGVPGHCCLVCECCPLQARSSFCKLQGFHGHLCQVISHFGVRFVLIQGDYRVALRWGEGGWWSEDYRFEDWVWVSYWFCDIK